MRSSCSRDTGAGLGSKSGWRKEAAEDGKLRAEASTGGIPDLEGSCGLLQVRPPGGPCRCAEGKDRSLQNHE